MAVDATRAEPALTLLHANFQNITLTSLDLRKVLAYSPNLDLYTKTKCFFGDFQIEISFVIHVIYM